MFILLNTISSGSYNSIVRRLGGHEFGVVLYPEKSRVAFGVDSTKDGLVVEVIPRGQIPYRGSNSIGRALVASPQAGAVDTPITHEGLDDYVGEIPDILRSFAEQELNPQRPYDATN